MHYVTFARRQFPGRDPDRSGGYGNPHAFRPQALGAPRVRRLIVNVPPGRAGQNRSTGEEITLSDSTNSEILAQRKADTQFREALLARPEFRYGLTNVMTHGGVEVTQQYSEGPGVLLVLRIRIINVVGITSDAFKGLRVIPVDDESGHYTPQTMGEKGEVQFGLQVHSVRFATA